MEKGDQEDVPDQCFYYEDMINCCNGSPLSFNKLNDIQKLQLGGRSPDFFICPVHLKREIRLFKLHQIKCCDPRKIHKKSVRLALVDVTLDIYNLYEHSGSIIPGQKLCFNCLYIHLPKWLENNPQPIEENESPHNSTPSADSQNTFPESQESVQSQSSDTVLNLSKTDDINSILKLLGIHDRIDNRNASKRHLDKIHDDINESLTKRLRLFEPTFTSCKEHDVDSLQEIIDQVKERLNLCKSNDEKCFVLSILPKSWSVPEISNRVGISEHLAEKTKKMVAELGVLHKPPPRFGKKIDPKHLELIKNFYTSDDISRMMAGIKDCKTYKIDGSKSTYQKRLMLFNLRDAYALFKENYPNIKVGRSKFAIERPRHCIFAGGPGTHTVCVCKTHQNIKLMLDSFNLKKLNPDHDWDYKYLLSKIICNEPTEECFYGECKYCPYIDEIILRIHELLTDDGVEELTFKQWMQTDRCILETFIRPVSEVLESLRLELPKLLRHDFISKQQSSFLKELKGALPFGLVLATGDFSEKYSITLQDSVQGFHWSNEQVTIHVWVCYFVDDSNELHHQSIIQISDCMTQDVNTVYACQEDMMETMKEVAPQMNKVSYHSDGASSQYKNKYNFSNLAHHEEDFGIPAEWHFFATSHGKGACDGVGGTFKRAAVRASLEKPVSKQITNAEELFRFAQGWDSKIICRFISKEKIAKKKKTWLPAF